jgi:hypothetical protein
MDQARSPRVLFVTYSYTGQTTRIVDAMADAFGARGWDVRRAPIEFTDKRYTGVFSRFPMPHALLGLVRMLPAQLLRRTGEIRIPDTARDRDVDLVVVGSPTWWLTTSVPIRSFLKSPEAAALLKGTPFTGFVVCRRYWHANLETVRKLGTKQGGRYVEGTKFTFQGGQVRSLLALLSYFRTGEIRNRFLGIRIPPTNLQPDNLEAARRFADELATTASGRTERIDPA